jgi:hypothetical protein
LCLAQDDVKRFISEPQPPPSGIEVLKEGKAKERREVGEGDDTVLQVQGVFTRIRSGATLKDLGGGALGSTTAAASTGSGFASDANGMAAARMGEKP